MNEHRSDKEDFSSVKVGIMKEMKVVSLFDGCATAKLALNIAKIPVGAYYSSEVDKYAMKVAQKNYPDIVQIGDVKQISYEE